MPAVLAIRSRLKRACSRLSIDVSALGKSARAFKAVTANPACSRNGFISATMKLWGRASTMVGGMGVSLGVEAVLFGLARLCRATPRFLTL